MSFLGYIYGLLAATIWGGWMVVTRLGVTTGLSEADIIVLRFGIAGILLLPIVFRHGLLLGGANHRSILCSIVLATGAGVPYVLLFTKGLSCAPTAHGILTPAFVPIFTMLLSLVFLKMKPSTSQIGGTILSVAGAMFLMMENDHYRNGDLVSAHLMFIGAAACWAVYTVASKAWKVEPLHGIAIVAVLSSIIYLPYYFIFHGNMISHVSLFTIGFQALMQGVLVSIVALIAYSKAIQLLGPMRAALFPILMPVIATLLAIPILGEWPSLKVKEGMFLICMGLGLTFFSPAIITALYKIVNKGDAL
jgi:drug/metabolite transporter (DMT)-like permease